MCIVIDMNVLPAVFSETASNHSDFKPVKDWVSTGPGFAVYGGTQYKKELERAPKYLAFLVELKKSQRLKEIDQRLVDDDQKQVEAIINDAHCDDAHLIAIFRVSGCRLLCSDDSRADEYIRPKFGLINGVKLYPRPLKRPSIYRGAAHSGLLCPKNIVKLQNVV